MAGFISLEDHFISDAVLAKSQNLPSFAMHLWPDDLQKKLCSIEDLRIEEMNKGEVALQVVSAVPAVDSLEICRDTNTQLAEAVRRSGGRLAGFAAVPIDDPLAAADELERCVRQLGFIGTLIPNHAAGKYYDSDEYRPFWKRAEELDVPVYLHPCPPSSAAKPLFQGNYPSDVGALISMGGFGWHADVAVHFLKLYGSGLFDVCPKLKLVIGHMGEMLPYMIGRSERRLVKTSGKWERGLLKVWAENLWITISGIWDLAPFACAIRSVPMDRLLFSVDYPFEKNEAGRDFMLKVRESGLLSEEQWEMVAYRNAEKLLKIKRPDTG